MSSEKSYIINIAIVCVLGVICVRSLLKEIAIFHLGKDVVKEKKKDRHLKNGLPIAGLVK